MKQQLLTWCKGVASFIKPVHLLVTIGLIVFFWVLIMGDQGLNRLRQLHQIRRNMTLQRQLLNQEIEEKNREKKLLEDPENLEMIIRKELGYIQPGEIIFQEAEKNAD